MSDIDDLFSADAHSLTRINIEEMIVHFRKGQRTFNLKDNKKPVKRPITVQIDLDDFLEEKVNGNSG